MALSFIDFDPTMKLSSSDVHRVGMANKQHESFMDVGQSASLLALRTVERFSSREHVIHFPRAQRAN